MLRKGHDSGIVVRSWNLTNVNFEDISHWSLHRRCTFSSKWENLQVCSVFRGNIISDGSVNTRVDWATHTLIRGERNQQFSLVTNWRWIHSSSLHILIWLENHIDGVETIMFTSIKTHQISSHLGSGNHFHGFCQLFDRVDWFHSDLELLFVGSKISVLHWNKELSIEHHLTLHWGRAEPLEVISRLKHFYQ